jgi:hypothetical protein
MTLRFATQQQQQNGNTLRFAMQQQQQNATTHLYLLAQGSGACLLIHV